MIARFDIQQRTNDWYAVKYRKVGGTLAKGLFIKSDTLFIDILSQYLEAFELPYEGFMNAEMMRGIELEPIAVQVLSDQVGVKFIECGWLESQECSMLGISPDGISSDLNIACEIKCPSAKKHTEYMVLGNEIPSEYVHQCLHYFTVNPNLEKLYFMSYRPESLYPIHIVELTCESILNIGTTAKPVLKSIAELKTEALNLALQLETKIKDKLFDL
jgi:hypothetical protein